MPPKRNNKQKQFARKKQITRRLMIISLKVDKYIYKNKPITISQAQMFLEELTSFKSQCLGDAPSLQVCEKLTRCMRGIIEEQYSNNAAFEDTETFTELNHPINLYALSPVYSLPDDDKTQMPSELPDVEPENNECNINENSNTHKGYEEENDFPTKSVRFSFEDQMKNNNLLPQTIDDTSKIIIDYNNERILNTNGSCNVNQELTNDIVDLALENNEQPISIDKDLCSQSLFKTLEINRTPKPYTLPSDDHFINDTCGQDMVEFDREITNLLDPEHKDSIEYNKDTLVHKITPLIQNTPVTMHEILEVLKTPEIGKEQTEILNEIKTNKFPKNKPTKEIKIRKKRTTNKKNKVIKPQVKQTNKTDSKISKNDANCSSLTNKFGTTLQASTNMINKPTNEFIISQKANINIEIRNANDPNIVPTLGTKKISNAVQIAGPNISSNTSSKIVCLEEDLSWVENLNYVREIHLEEYDATFKPSDAFWENCDLPNNWDGRDFE